MSKQTKPKRPVYNLEFKQDAAKLVIEKGYTHQQAADNLGVSLSAHFRRKEHLQCLHQATGLQPVVI